MTGFIRRARRRIPLLSLVTLALVLTMVGGERRAAATCLGPGPLRWQINEGGVFGLLTIANGPCQSVGFSGSLAFPESGATVTRSIQGFWDAEDQKLTFYTTEHSPDERRFYTGYAYQSSDGLHLLSGFAEAFRGRGGSAQRPVFGWYAFAPLPTAGPIVRGVGSSTLDLPLGEETMLEANGFRLGLTFTALDAAGNLLGHVTEGNARQAISGFFDRAAQKVTFVRHTNSSDPTTLQLFTGYLLVTNATADTPRKLRLAGTFDAFAGSGATAARSVFGWLAGYWVIDSSAIDTGSGGLHWGDARPRLLH